MSKFDDAIKINVNDKTEKKGNLTYLSWAWAWAEFKKIYPDATYEVVKFGDGKPYYCDEKTGYMCYTKVRADGIEHEMWLPVMDSRNKAMLQPTMFDINKTIMRCLTKNLAMFGLGLYIYAGEDLPEDEKSNDEMTVETYKKLHEEINRAGVSIKSICAAYKVDDLGKLTEKQAQAAIKKIASKPAKQVYDAGNQV